MVALKPFKIEVSEEQLQWINERVRTARIPAGKNLAGEDLDAFGLPSTTAQRLHKYWATHYDWRAVEKAINQEMMMFTLPIQHADEEHTIHFVYHRSTRPDAIPLLFLHGWPGSFLEARRILDPLTSPSFTGEQAYHVVAPSLPGFGFSSYPGRGCSPMEMATIMNKLMLQLSFDKYMVQGGDWGSIVGRALAIKYPKHCRALHLNFIPATPPSPLWDPIGVGKLAIAWLTGGWNLTPFANKMFKRMQWWMKSESGYASIQGTKPQTLAYALCDSPFGQMCWIREKLEKLVAPDYFLTEEDTITWSMPYIINGTAGPSEIYKWAQPPLLKEMEKDIFHKVIGADVAVGCSTFHYDVMYVPKWWALSRIAKNIPFWKEHEKGGHFPSVEVPALLLYDIRSFTKTLSADTVRELRSSNFS